MTILDAFRLDGKVVLVTGANRGLGAAMAVGLAQAGADVVGLSRGEAREVAQQVTALGRRFHHVGCDLLAATPNDLQQVVAEVVAKLGRLDILVNNAGIVRRRVAFDCTEADWDDVVQINLRAAFYLAQAAGRVMRTQGGGKIINIASVLAFEGGLLASSYAATKHALVGLTQALANEWAAANINVNAIAPGYFATDMTETLETDPVRGPAILQRIPAGRFGRPEELQGVVVFSASAAASYAHGATFVVDGGWLGR